VREIQRAEHGQRDHEHGRDHGRSFSDHNISNRTRTHAFVIMIPPRMGAAREPQRRIVLGDAGTPVLRAGKRTLVSPRHM